MRALLLRLSLTIALLLLIFAGSRALIRALPGDPLSTLMAESGTTLPVEVLREELGLDRPFFLALGQDLSRALHGDLGISLLSREPIAPLLAERFFNTLELTFIALLLALGLSLVLGLSAASRPGHWIDSFCTGYGALTAALPTPWIGPVLLLAFAVWVPIFPVGGHVALPALTLALALSGLWARLIRERVREVLQHGAAPGARARGIAEWKVTLKYGLAPAAGALVAYLGTQVGALLAGAFVTEVLFDWHGMGSLVVDAVLKRDYPMVESGVFVAASAAFLGTLAGDWLQSALDPRVREIP
jgi:ABC-type dipeptide/oligopeptide/nickel transport system permease component